MIEALLTAFGLVFAWPAIGYLMLGIGLGIWIGAIPGLGGIIGLVLLLPFTFGMETIPAFALLLGLWTVTATSDTISSVMLGIPGTAASQATILDGYPMAQKGLAAKAFGAAFTVSAIGGVVGAIILAVSLPIISPVIMAFGSPELFALGMLGLAMVGTLSGASIMKGLAAGMLGLMLGTIGLAETVAIPRYTFGSLYLMDELPIIPVVLGLFAIPELMELAVKNVSISRVPKDQAVGGGIIDGILEVRKHWWLALRCSILGSYIGMLPGLGASIVDWIAYGHAVQSAKDKSQFGKGDIRGVIAPEAANNAIKGGALIPTVAFGIPGSLGTSILLGALIMQGLRPGPMMLSENLHITFSLVWMIVVANIVVAGLLMLWSKQVAKIAFLPGHLVVPGVIVFVFMGAWLGGASYGDWITCLTIGIVGFIMKRGGWPRPPLVLALILGNILENTFQISNRAYDGLSWLTRPIVMIVVALVVLTLIFAVRGIIKHKKGQSNDPDSAVVGEGGERNPLVSLPFSVALGIMFVWAAFESISWPAEVRQFPIIIAIPGAILVFVTSFHDSRDLVRARAAAGSLANAVYTFSEQAVLPKALMFFGYLIVMLLLTLVVGQKIAMPIFIGLYLWRWGGYGLRVSLGYALGGWAFIVLFYDQVMHLIFHPSFFYSMVQPLVPEWFPGWLIY